MKNTRNFILHLVLVNLLLCGAFQHTYAQSVSATQNPPVYNGGQMQYSVSGSSSGNYYIETSDKAPEQTLLNSSYNGGQINYQTNEPGVYFARLSNGAFGAAAYKPFEIQTTSTEPSDFDAYWSGIVNSLPAPNAQLSNIQQGSVTTADLRLDNIEGRKVYCKIAYPTNGSNMGGILRIQAFSNSNDVQSGLISTFAQQYNVIAVAISGISDVPYGQGGSAASPQENRDDFYYKISLAACYQALRYMASRADYSAAKGIGLFGESQGGGLSLMVGGIDARNDNLVKCLLVSQPILCDNSGILFNKASGFPNYVFYGRQQNMNENNIAAAAAYYDATHAAKRIDVPVYLSIGYRDFITQPAGGFAAFNELRGPVHLAHGIDKGHEHSANGFWSGLPRMFFGRYLNGDITPASGSTVYFVDAGPDKNTTQGANVSLSGEIDDSNTQSSPNISVQWSCVTCPATPNFSNPNNYTTNATFPVNGTYTLRFGPVNSTGNAADKLYIPSGDPNLYHTAADYVVVTVGSVGCTDNDDDGICQDDDCNDNDANFPKPVGTSCNDNNSNTINDSIQADGCTCVGTPDNGNGTVSCGEITITYGSGQIAMQGQNGINYFFKVHDLNNDWIEVFSCAYNCGSSQTATDIDEGFYKIKIYNSSWQPICDTDITMSDDGGCTDNDGDGVCQDNDCNDNDANFPKPAGTSCNDNNSNTYNDIIQADGCTCAGTPDNGSCLADKNAGGNAANIAALDAAYNNPSPYSFRHMMGINDAGQFQGIGNVEVNPISYLTPNMRAFHAMDYDFNDQPQLGVTTYEELTKPKDTDGFPAYIDDVTSYTNFTGIQGMTNISAATEILNRGNNLTWKEKIWEESDWYNLTGGMTIPDGIRQSYQNYTEAFIDVHAPAFGNQLISSYEVGNELWDYPYEEDYHAMLEGAYNAFLDEYGTNTTNWKMKLLPGSFNAASTSNTCGTALRNFSNCGFEAGSSIYYQMGDYLDVNNCDILSSFYAVNTHAYPFGEGTLSYVHPEEEDNEFLTFKAAVAFRDANPVFAGKGVWLTETGYDSGTTGCNGGPSNGVGEVSQAAMNLRIFMMTSRYHIERVNFYMGFDNGPSTNNPAYGCTYVSSGFWKLGYNTAGGYHSARPSDGATPKPAFFAFSSFLDKFNDKVFTEAVAENDNVYAYILANQDGTDPYLVFWSPTATNDGNALNSLNVNQFVSLPSGYKVATTAATPFSTDGNETTTPFAPDTAPTFTAVNGTSAGSTTITRVKRMPSYIRLTTGNPTACNDGVQNQGETGVDCGGPCPACPSGCNTPQQITLLSNDVSQSSNHISNSNATADNAVDGETAGAWDEISQTNWGFDEWWQADLGQKYDIDRITLWNITTGNQGHMVDVHVFVSDSPFTSDVFETTQNDPNVDDYLISGQLGRPSTVNINSTGRYIRIQKAGQGFITLDEVQVFGCPQQTCTVGASCDDGNPNTQNDRYNSNCECVGTIVNPGTCSAIDISTSGNTININNLYNEHQIIKIYNQTWTQVLDECNSYNGGNCKPSYSYTASAGTYQVQVLINGSEGEQCNETETVQIGNGNKFAQLNDEQRLLIFPNPIENNSPTLVLDSPEDAELNIQIYNINSQLVHTQSANTISGVNEITLDLEHARLASGVYFVKVISEKYTYGATRFVKP